MSVVTIREYGVLFPDDVDTTAVTDGIDSRIISKTAWDWLLQETGVDAHKFLVKPFRRRGLLCLQVMNYVGVITTPCGCQIEVLPKIYAGNSTIKGELELGREKLYTMLCRVGSLPFKTFHHASLKLFEKPLPDVLIHQFLMDTKKLIKQGIRNDYVAFREEAPFLRGKLQLAAQVRQPVARQHLFQIEHDEFLPDRAENRLIHSALIAVSKYSKTNSNKRLANELLFMFDEIPVSRNKKMDFSKWQLKDRPMVHYRPLKRWCELVLNQQSPFSLAGDSSGLSFLFPMNVLFEKYVAVVLRKQLKEGYELEEQVASKNLVEKFGEFGKQKFRLKPDLVIKRAKDISSVLDTKWKRVDENDEAGKYGVSQSDMYQMFAYGKKYLNDGKGSLFLIYPESEKFQVALPVFSFEEGLNLWVVPFKWSIPEGEEDHVEFGSTSSEFIEQNKR